MLHRINRLRFEMQCAEESQAFQLRHSFTEVLQAQICNAIDRTCSKFSVGDELLHIERVEIDLGRFSPFALERDLAPVFQQRFEAELIKLLGPSGLEEHQAKLEHTPLELLQHFLLSGNLPWWGEQTDLDIDELLLQVQEQTPATLQAFFYRHLDNRRLWQRLILQLGYEAKHAIVFLLAGLRGAAAYIFVWLETLTVSGKVPEMAHEFSEKLLDTLLHHTHEIVRCPLDSTGFFRAINTALQSLADSSGAPAESSLLALLCDQAIQAEKTAAEHSSAMKLAADLMTAHSTDTLVDEATAASLLPAHPPDRATPPNIFFTQDDSPFSTAEFVEDSSSRYLVRHAGLVLLAPFFGRFFDACGLLQGAEWKHKTAQYQAVHLLKYLCTGSGKTPEYALLLEKLCCGIAIDDPIPLDAELQTLQLQEADALLSAVIGHWRALKNTSINGLRETFLKRDGILRAQNGVWQLQIERKTLDVLLDSIPWGYSTLALPWNDYLIQVEW